MNNHYVHSKTPSPLGPNHRPRHNSDQNSSAWSPRQARALNRSVQNAAPSCMFDSPPRDKTVPQPGTDRKHYHEAGVEPERSVLLLVGIFTSKFQSWLFNLENMSQNAIFKNPMTTGESSLCSGLIGHLAARFDRGDKGSSWLFLRLCVFNLCSVSSVGNIAGGIEYICSQLMRAS